MRRQTSEYSRGIVDEEDTEALGVECLEAANNKLNWGVFLVILAMIHDFAYRAYHVGQREARHVKQNRLTCQQRT